METTEILDNDGTRQYQKIIGIGQWLVVAGRFDFNCATSSPSRYAAATRNRRLAIAEEVLGYL
jgi:hypothetical protein